MNPHGKREAERNYVEPEIVKVFDAILAGMLDGPTRDCLNQARNLLVDTLIKCIDRGASFQEMSTKNVELHAETVSLRAELAGMQVQRDEVLAEMGRRVVEGVHLKSARTEAIAQVNRLVAEVAVSRSSGDVVYRDMCRHAARIDELETCLRDAPREEVPPSGVCVYQGALAYHRQAWEHWSRSRDALLAGPPANVIQTVGEIDMVEERHTASADDDTCPGCGVVWSCVCPAPDEVDPAPPAEAERPSDKEIDATAAFLEDMDADIQAERVMRLLAYTKRLESQGLETDGPRNYVHRAMFNQVRERAEAAETRAAGFVAQLAELARMHQVERDQLRALLESARAEEGERRTYEQELAAVINRFGVDDECDTPDFILARAAMKAVAQVGKSVRARDEWLGRKSEPIRTLLTPSEGGK